MKPGLSNRDGSDFQPPAPALRARLKSLYAQIQGWSDAKLTCVGSLAGVLLVAVAFAVAALFRFLPFWLALGIMASTPALGWLGLRSWRNRTARRLRADSGLIAPQKPHGISGVQVRSVEEHFVDVPSEADDVSSELAAAASHALRKGGSAGCPPLQTHGSGAGRMKLCPFCGEGVLAVAAKCKHCGEWLNAPAAAGTAGSPQGNNAGARSGAQGFVSLATLIGFVVGVAVTNLLMTDSKGATPIHAIIDGFKVRKEINEATAGVKDDPSGVMPATGEACAGCVEFSMLLMAIVLAFGGAIGAGLFGGIASGLAGGRSASS